MVMIQPAIPKCEAREMRRSLETIVTRPDNMGGIKIEVWQKYEDFAKSHRKCFTQEVLFIVWVSFCDILCEVGFARWDLGKIRQTHHMIKLLCCAFWIGLVRFLEKYNLLTVRLCKILSPSPRKEATTFFFFMLASFRQEKNVTFSQLSCVPHP